MASDDGQVAALVASAQASAEVALGLGAGVATEAPVGEIVAGVAIEAPSAEAAKALDALLGRMPADAEAEAVGHHEQGAAQNSGTPQQVLDQGSSGPLGTRGALAQSMKRKMKKLTNLNDLYSDLADDEKLEFRKAYSVKKDFEFVEESRVERKSWSRETNEAGEFMTEIQIYKLLGGDMPDEISCWAVTCLGGWSAVIRLGG